MTKYECTERARNKARPEYGERQQYRDRLVLFGEEQFSEDGYEKRVDRKVVPFEDIADDAGKDCFSTRTALHRYAPAQCRLTQFTLPDVTQADLILFCGVRLPD